MGSWKAQPQGCSRDAWDGKPLAETSEVVSFFWEDWFDQHQIKGMQRAEEPDAPLRLDLYREGGGVAGRLQTVVHPGVTLNRTLCRQLDVQTSEQPATYAEGRPTLRGTVRLDCDLKSGHLTADVTFSRCEF